MTNKNPGIDAIVNDWFFLQLGYKGIKEKYGVCDQCVRDWLRSAGIPKLDKATLSELRGLKNKLTSLSGDNPSTKRKRVGIQKRLDAVYKRLYKEYSESTTLYRHGTMPNRMHRELMELRYGYQYDLEQIAQHLGVTGKGKLRNFPSLLGVPPMTHAEIIELKTCRYWMYGATNSRKRRKYQIKYNEFWIGLAERHGYHGTVHLIPVEE